MFSTLIKVLGGAVIGALVVEHFPAIKTSITATKTKAKALVHKTGSHIGLDLGHIELEGG